MSNDRESNELPFNDKIMLENLSQKMERSPEVEPLSPRDFYRQFHEVLGGVDSALVHAYRVLDHFQAWHRPIDASQAIQKVDARISELTTLPDHLRDEVFAALSVHNSLILDTEPAAVEYISTLEQQPRIAAQNIMAEYRNRLAAIESELRYEEAIAE